jgi:hypothetical protein
MLLSWHHLAQPFEHVLPDSKIKESVKQSSKPSLSHVKREQLKVNSSKTFSLMLQARAAL